VAARKTPRQAIGTDPRLLGSLGELSALGDPDQPSLDELTIDDLN
jgi:hypothetical protein